jgi:hypothetical protein
VAAAAAHHQPGRPCPVEAERELLDLLLLVAGWCCLQGDQAGAAWLLVLLALMRTLRRQGHKASAPWASHASAPQTTKKSSTPAAATLAIRLIKRL